MEKQHYLNRPQSRNDKMDKPLRLSLLCHAHARNHAQHVVCVHCSRPLNTNTGFFFQIAFDLNSLPQAYDIERNQNRTTTDNVDLSQPEICHVKKTMCEGFRHYHGHVLIKCMHT